MADLSLNMEGKMNNINEMEQYLGKYQKLIVKESITQLRKNSLYSFMNCVIDEFKDLNDEIKELRKMMAQVLDKNDKINEQSFIPYMAYENRDNENIKIGGTD